MFVVPLLGVLCYLIVNRREMGQRDAEHAKAAQPQLDDHVRSVSGSHDGPAAEIEKAKQLLGSGAITQAEFGALKPKAVG